MHQIAQSNTETNNWETLPQGYSDGPALPDLLRIKKQSDDSSALFLAWAVFLWGRSWFHLNLRHVTHPAASTWLIDLSSWLKNSYHIILPKASPSLSLFLFLYAVLLKSTPFLFLIWETFTNIRLSKIYHQPLQLTYEHLHLKMYFCLSYETKFHSPLQLTQFNVRHACDIFLLFGNSVYRVWQPPNTHHNVSITK